MEQIVNIIVNNGTAVGCLVYFMWYNANSMKDMKSTIEKLTEVIVELKNAINK